MGATFLLRGWEREARAGRGSDRSRHRPVPGRPGLADGDRVTRTVLDVVDARLPLVPDRPAVRGPGLIPVPVVVGVVPGVEQVVGPEDAITLVVAGAPGVVDQLRRRVQVGRADE